MQKNCPRFFRARPGVLSFDAGNCRGPRLHCRQSRSAVVSFRTDSHVVVPTDYYHLLQVHPTSSREAVRQKYETRIAHPPVATYSTEVLFSRAVLLKVAADSLTDQAMRLAYERKLGHGLHELKVSQADLPGALVLLQEAGDADAVVELAGGWLDRNAAAPDAGDVAVCLALAHCDRASSALQASPPTVLHACGELEMARAVLVQYRVVQQLHEQVTQALQDLAPEQALGLVSLPLGPQHAQQRARGVNLLAATLTQRIQQQQGHGGQATGYPNDDLDDEVEVGRRQDDVLQAAQHQLTAAEQVSLGLPLCQSRDAGALLTHQPGLVYDTALALIAEGHRNGWAHYIHLADQLLHRVQQAGVPRTAGGTQAALFHGPAAGAAGGTDESVGGTSTREQLSVERAVCAVLLADAATAVAVLGLPGGRDKAGRGWRQQEADPEVVAFVMEHAAEDGHDLLPGLHALTECWLAHVVMPSFRAPPDAGACSDAGDSTADGVSPAAWYKDGKVAAYLQVWHVARFAGILLEAAHSLISAWSAFSQVLQRSCHASSSHRSSTATAGGATSGGPEADSSRSGAPVPAATAATAAAAKPDDDGSAPSFASGVHREHGGRPAIMEARAAGAGSPQGDGEGDGQFAAAGSPTAKMAAAEGRALGAAAAVAAAEVARGISERASTSYDDDISPPHELLEPTAGGSEPDMQGALRALEAEMWDSVHVPIAWRALVLRAAVLGVLIMAAVFAVVTMQKKPLARGLHWATAQVAAAASSR